MKLEKREITLNEADSLQDTLYIAKSLLSAYTEHLAEVDRKETAELLVRHIKETAEELVFIAAIQKKQSNKNM
ncbi:MAG: hypothetical protein IJ393_00080 [Clostridia bacterium]|nr:hypothetical protein [Clostridia bacterium]